MLRTPVRGQAPLTPTGQTARCLNLGSYNYLGFAAADPYCTPRVLAALRAGGGVSTCSARSDAGGWWGGGVGVTVGGTWVAGREAAGWGWARAPRAAGAGARSPLEPPSPLPSLLSGTTPKHLELEAMVAAFVRKPAALTFGMGFATNSAVLPALAGPGTLVLSDALNHASIVAGVRGSGAKVKARGVGMGWEGVGGGGGVGGG